jgi:hypothetical protein
MSNCNVAKVQVRAVATIAALAAILSTAEVVASDSPTTTTTFAGLWKPTTYIQELRTTDGTEPPLLPDARAVYRRHAAAYAAGDRSFYGVHECLNLGQPRMNFIPYPIEIIEGKNTLLMVYEWNGYRRIDMSGKPPKVDYPVLNGASAGRFEDGDLVIRTVGLLGTTFLDAAGMPHSEDLTITERLRLLDRGAVLQDDMTFDDPKTFSKPWSTTVRWKRLPAGTELHESVCVDRISAGKPALDPKN